MDELQTTARAALQRATDFSFSCQQPDGHWVAPVSSDASFTAQYVMFRYAIPGLTIGDDADEIARWLLGTQSPIDGSWNLAPGLEGDLSVSIEVYLALRLLGTPASEYSMRLARDFILSKGGIAKVRFLTLVFLAVFDLYPWEAMPQMPVELMLMPTWAPLNIYAVSSWARSTLVPILLLFHHRPVYPLPRDSEQCGSAYLDELWIDPSHKHVSFATLSDAFWGCEFLKMAFILGDKMIASLGGFRRGPQRRLAIRRCVRWLLEHQEESGGWAGFLAPIYFSMWALNLEGYAVHDDRIQRGLAAMDRLLIRDSSGTWIQTTDSPCWDTALMIKGLCDAGIDKRDPRITSAVQWLKDRQLRGPEGDWRVYSPNQQPGAWSFEYHNNWYPDVDDTAAVIITLVGQDSSAVTSDSVASAANWILGMQNRDGGWAAFDTNNDAEWFKSIPFNDMDNFSDPSSADITGRVVECFGILLRTRTKGQGIDQTLSHRMRHAVGKAIPYLLRQQDSQGSWFGRWACNHFYGTSNVIRGLGEFCVQGEPKEIHRAISRGLRWIEAHQNEDGGWGEEFSSYFDDAMIGRGRSTAAQTAWALDTLLRFRPPSDMVTMTGVRWLVKNQNSDEKAKSDYSSWPSNSYVGVGFPGAVLLGYPFFHHHFAISALGRFLSSCHREALLDVGCATRSGVFTPPAHIVSAVSSLDILLLAPGSRSDIDILMRVAKRLQQKGHRARIASCANHQASVEKHGFDFYDVGESLVGPGPLMLLRCILTGGIGRLHHAVRQKTTGFIRAGFDSSPVVGGKQMQNRPFMANAIVAMPPSNVHIHAAASLQIPLVLVTPQPELAGDKFPAPFSLRSRQACAGLLIEYLSLFLVNILHWVMMSYITAGRGGFRDHLRHCTPLTIVHRARSDNDGSSIAAHMVESQVQMSRQDKAPCAVIPSIEAQWRHSGHGVRLSGVVAASLVDSAILCWDDLIPCSRLEWGAERQSWLSISLPQRFLFCIPVFARLCLLFGLNIDYAKRQAPSPVLVARIQRAKYDLQFVKENLDGNSIGLEKRFADCWSAVLSSRLHEEFRV